MTSGFTTSQLSAIRALVLDDLRTSGHQLGIFDLYDGRTGSGTSPDAQRLLEGNIGGEDDLFAQADGHWMRVSAHQVEDAAAAILFQVQDDVIDELGRGWPEITDKAGAFMGVAVPTTATSSEAAGWYVGSQRISPIGELARNV